MAQATPHSPTDLVEGVYVNAQGSPSSTGARRRVSGPETEGATRGVGRERGPVRSGEGRERGRKGRGSPVPTGTGTERVRGLEARGRSGNGDEVSRQLTRRSAEWGRRRWSRRRRVSVVVSLGAAAAKSAVKGRGRRAVVVSCGTSVRLVSGRGQCWLGRRPTGTRCTDDDRRRVNGPTLGFVRVGQSVILGPFRLQQLTLAWTTLNLSVNVRRAAGASGGDPVNGSSKDRRLGTSF